VRQPQSELMTNCPLTVDVEWLTHLKGPSAATSDTACSCTVLGGGEWQL